MQSNLTVIHLFTIEWSLFSLWKKAASKPWAEIALEGEKRDKCLSWEGEHNHQNHTINKQKKNTSPVIAVTCHIDLKQAVTEPQYIVAINEGM